MNHRSFSIVVAWSCLSLLAAADEPAGIVAPGASVERLGTGMAFTEGPVWIPARKTLVFSDIPNSMQMQWTAADGVKPFRKVAQSNGNLLDLQGRLLSCQHAGRNVIRTGVDGKITVLSDKFEGKKLNSPNDLAIRADGSIWFTDPSYGLRGRPAEVPGRWVFRLDPESKALRVVYKGFDMPNGIAFSPDEQVIYIADSGNVAKLRAFAVPEKGLVGDPIFEIDVRCDGMCVDTKGNIYTTAKGGIHVFDNSGKKLGLIKTPEQPANVCFGGDQYDTLFITARTSLYRVKTLATGCKPVGAKW